MTSQRGKQSVDDLHCHSGDVDRRAMELARRLLTTRPQPRVAKLGAKPRQVGDAAKPHPRPIPPTTDRSHKA